MSEFIEVPIETNADELAADAFDFIEARIPDWVPNDGNLDTITVEAMSLMTAEARDVASAVPTDIFRYFGKLVGILPKEDSFATATTTWTVQDTAGYTIPAGTQVGIVIAGDEVVAFETVADTIIASGASTATGVIIQAIDAGSESSGLLDTLNVNLLDPLAFVTNVDLTSTTSGGEDAESTDDYLNRLSARLELMTQHPILASDFAVFAQDIDGVARAMAMDGYNPDHNRLTVNQSSLETDTTGWVAETNCVIARDTTQAADGIANLRLTSSASGNMTALTTPTNTYAVVPGQKQTALASFRSAVSARSCRVELGWYDASLALLNFTQGATVTDTTTGWTAAFVTGTAPANAAWVRIRVIILATGAALEAHYVDKIALKNTPSQTWNIGGTPEYNNERYVSVAAVDDAGAAVSSGIKLAIDDYLEAKREVNFVVAEIDPDYYPIDVNFTAVSKPGFVASDVEAAAEAAVTSYLSPANWGLPDVAVNASATSFTPMWINTTVVRLYELATVINEVPGIDYIAAGSLQIRVSGGSFGILDINLGGPAPMPQPGTINGTVTDAP